MKDIKIIMVMLTTLDGRITRGNDPNIYTWTSKEDQDYFFRLLANHNVMIFGSQTYEAAKDRIQLSEDRLRIVLTRNPKKYTSVVAHGQLEFSDESPEKLVKRLKNLGYKKVLLLGGGVINGLFLKTKLVDEVYLTLEPHIFGEGKPLAGGEPIDISLQLKSIQKLNIRGTLLLKYKVLK